MIATGSGDAGRHYICVRQNMRYNLNDNTRNEPFRVGKGEIYTVKEGRGKGSRSNCEHDDVEVVAKTSPQFTLSKKCGAETSLVIEL